MEESGSRGHSLAPTLLLSMPQLLDPNFERSVILLCEHGTEGAFGLVLNRPTETPAADVVGHRLRRVRIDHQKPHLRPPGIEGSHASPTLL